MPGTSTSIVVVAARRSYAYSAQTFQRSSSRRPEESVARYTHASR